MRAVHFASPEQIEIRDIPIPEISDNEVLAKVAYAGFCGTDLDLLTGDMVHIKNGFTTYPIIPGHEWSGVVEMVGKNVKGFKLGDKVTSDVSLGCGMCDYCRRGAYNLCPNRLVVGSFRNKQGVFAEYIAIPSRHLYKVPDNVSLEQAALAEPAGTAVYAVRRAGIAIGDDVVVVGDGPIGQLAAQVALINGAARVIMVGSWDQKLTIAQKNGVCAVVNYHREDMAEACKAHCSGVGPNVVIETSGNNKALNASINMLKHGGKIVMVSWYNGAEIEVAVNQAIAKDCDLIGVLASPNTFEAVFAYMAQGVIKTAPLITHIEPLENIAQTIKMIRAKKECRIKVLLKP